MLFAIALIVAVVAAAGLFTLAVLSRRDKPAGRYRARPMQVAVRTVRPSVLPRAADPESVSDGVVFVRPMGEGQALVLGQSADLDVIGTTVSALPENIARGLTQGNAALQAAVGAGAASGRLVMLTQESAAALKAMGPIKDSSGAVLGVVRDGSGKFSNVLRFTQADKLATLASLGPALSGIALQMQLAAISRKLDGIQQSVDRIEQNQDDELASSVETNLALAMRDYAQLQQTGVISDTHWALIASRSKSVEDNVRQIGKQMNRLVDQLVAVAGKKGGIRAGERLERLDRFNKRRPTAVLELYLRAQQAVVLGELLHVHRLVSSDDAHLEVHRAACEERARTALAEADSRFSAFDKAIVAAGDGDTGAPWHAASAWFNDYDAELKESLKKLRKQTRPIVLAAHSTAKEIGLSSSTALTNKKG